MKKTHVLFILMNALLASSCSVHVLMWVKVNEWEGSALLERINTYVHSGAFPNYDSFSYYKETRDEPEDIRDLRGKSEIDPSDIYDFHCVDIRIDETTKYFYSRTVDQTEYIGPSEGDSETLTSTRPISVTSSETYVYFDAGKLGYCLAHLLDDELKEVSFLTEAEAIESTYSSLLEKGAPNYEDSFSSFFVTSFQEAYTEFKEATSLGKEKCTYAKRGDEILDIRLSNYLIENKRSLHSYNCEVRSGRLTYAHETKAISKSGIACQRKIDESFSTGLTKWRPDLEKYLASFSSEEDSSLEGSSASI